MALIIKNNNYLRIDGNGNYIIYKNKTARNKEKKSLPILAKYNEILTELEKDTQEKAYYDPEYLRTRLAWENELLLYKQSISCNINTNKFPLIEQYFPDINQTIPTIIQKGKIWVPQNLTQEEVYNFIKKYEIFGKADEIKDA